MLIPFHAFYLFCGREKAISSTCKENFFFLHTFPISSSNYRRPNSLLRSPPPNFANFLSVSQNFPSSSPLPTLSRMSMPECYSRNNGDLSHLSPFPLLFGAVISQEERGGKFLSFFPPTTHRSRQQSAGFSHKNNSSIKTIIFYK